MPTAASRQSAPHGSIREKGDAETSTSRTFAVLGAFLAVSAGSALATVYTFTADYGDWSIDAYWWPPGGPPGATDTAVIPSGKECVVGVADQYVDTLIIQGAGASGGKLGIIGRTLSVYGYEHHLDGVLYFQAEAGRTPTLNLDSLGIFAGTGAMDARRASGYGPAYVDGEFRAESINVAGSITFRGRLINNGRFVVDGPDDVMNLGVHLSVQHALGGSGKFEVYDGTLNLLMSMHPGPGG